MLVVGMGEDPSLGEYERLLLSMKTTARKELVLLHPSRSVVPGSTRAWLQVSGAHLGGALYSQRRLEPTMGTSASARRASSKIS